MTPSFRAQPGNGIVRNGLSAAETFSRTSPEDGKTA